MGWRGGDRAARSPKTYKRKNRQEKKRQWTSGAGARKEVKRMTS